MSAKTAGLNNTLPPNTEAKLRYLDGAANLLMASSPALSAYLGAEYNYTTSVHLAGRPEHEREGRACGACGTLMVPSWSCKTVREDSKSSKKVRQPTKDPTSDQERFVVYICSRCNCKTRVRLPKKPTQRIQMKASKLAAARPPLPPPTTDVLDTTPKRPAAKLPPEAARAEPIPELVKEEAASSSVNTGSKKRARARKQGGLQAMLAKNKQQQAPTGGFDLMDFMKST